MVLNCLPLIICIIDVNIFYDIYFSINPSFVVIYIYIFFRRILNTEVKIRVVKITVVILVGILVFGVSLSYIYIFSIEIALIKFLLIIETYSDIYKTRYTKIDYRQYNM